MLQHQQDEESDILKIALCMALALIPPVVSRSNIFPLLSLTYRARARAHTHTLSLSLKRSERHDNDEACFVLSPSEFVASASP
jgi:hypothetical protein